MNEVELKFPLGDRADFAARLATLGAVLGSTIEQVDAYYNHPARDFAQTDEALRLRSVDGEDRLTYKGPKLGGAARTREEIELPLAAGTAGGWADVLDRLGFRRVATVSKRRTLYRLDRGRTYELSIDDVQGLGLFAEIETLAEPADSHAAADDVARLAAELGLSDPEPRSYLELVLANSER
ncbi:class IV adenylate cyclase [Botrimarina sp.]|uniref:class IV adenylate cyclase n=1 Tax=Botrimarina sp. TaxID=2795802 RepID=UPI0032EC5A3D